MNLNWKWYLKDLETVEKNGFNVFSCFSCGGGSSMGYKLAGFNVIGNCEIDQAMNKLYVANHHPKYNFNMDVRDFAAIENDKLPKALFNLDILDGSPPCFAAGTLVKTAEGYKPIEEVQVGDMVFTHMGRYREVMAVMSHPADNVCSVKAQGTFPIVCTENHPFFTRRMDRRNHDEERRFSDKRWKPAGELNIERTVNEIKEQDYVGIPLCVENRIPEWNGVMVRHNVCGKAEMFDIKKSLDLTSPDFWYFVGRYVGDGWRRKDRKVVVICDGKDKEEELRQAIERAGLRALATEQRTTFRFEIFSAELYEFLEPFGCGAENKCIPEFVLELPNSLLEFFMRGYLSADGHRYEDGKWSITSVSPKLILGIQMVVAKLWKQPTTIGTKDNSGSVIEGRSVECKPAYSLRFSEEKRKQQHYVAEDDYLWVPFRESHKEAPQQVYNLSVKEDESYTVFNIAVHNCSVFSSAGEREKGWNTEKQFREGQKLQRLDDLFFWFIDIAKKLQPKVVIAENVKGLTAGNARGYVNEIIKAYREAGYNTQIFLLNAATMGVPQARERVFFISSRRDLGFGKIKMEFSEKQIAFGEVRTEHGKPFTKTQSDFSDEELLKYRKPTDTCIEDINLRIRGKKSGFTRFIVSDDRPACTLTASGSYYRMCDALKLSDKDAISIQTFPQDYDFIDQSPQYVCGMSVPPVMMARIAHEIDRQWLRPGDQNV